MDTQNPIGLNRLILATLLPLATFVQVVIKDRRRTWAAAMVCGAAGLLLILAALHVLSPAWRSEHPLLHSAMEAGGGLAAILMAMLLASRRAERSGGRLPLLMLGFLGMGVLDSFHAVVEPGRGFVLLHSMAGVAGSSFFALVCLPRLARDYEAPWKRWMPWAVVIAASSLGIWTLAARETVPHMTVHGQFTGTAIALNVVSGLLFLAAAARLFVDFVRDGRVDSYIFSAAATLFGIAGLMFPWSSIWGNVWWTWHALRLGTYILLLWYIVWSYRQAEAALRESEERHRTTLYSIGDAVIATDANGFVVQMNHVAEALTGWREAEARGRPLTEVFHIFNEETRAVVESPVARVLREGQVVGLANHTLLIAKDDTERPIADSGAPIRNERGETTGSVLVFRDQTGERAVQRALQEKERKYRALFENAQIGMYRSKIDGSAFLDVNKKFAEIIGYSPEELVGAPGRIRWADPGDRGRMLDALKAQGGALANYEARVLAKNGEAKDVLASITLNPDEGYLEGTMLDITAHKRAREAQQETQRSLLQAARLATMGELAASIAHELNNPLATISLRLETMSAQTPGDDPRRRLLDVVTGEIDRMAALVANLLNFTRRGSQRISTVDVADEIDKTLELISYHLRKLGIDTKKVVGPDVPPVFSDRQQLRQLFLNLFQNAADAMPGGGALSIGISTSADRRTVLIDVKDTGIGIAPEHLARLGEPFFTTKPEGKGTGLGLSICQRIAAEHHGEMTIESEPGKGTTVRIVLPVKSGANGTHLSAKGE